MLLKIQRYINNSIFVIIEKIFNEAVYNFTSIQSIDLWKFFSNIVVASSSKFNFDVNNNFSFVVRVRMKITNAITFAQIEIKRNYNNKHKSIYIRKKNYALIKLHYNYNIFFIVVLKLKYNQQYVEFFRILKRIKKLIYKLNLFVYYRIYSMLFIV